MRIVAIAVILALVVGAVGGFQFASVRGSRELGEANDRLSQLNGQLGELRSRLEERERRLALGSHELGAGKQSVDHAKRVADEGIREGEGSTDLRAIGDGIFAEGHSPSECP